MTTRPTPSPSASTNLDPLRTPVPAHEPEDGQERRERHSSSTPGTDRHDRNKIRRSLQRTLREGAGHISHHRSRKGKEPASAGAGSDETGALDAADVLTRGTGSFVVHGKKASVITFGNELQYQTMSPDERIRLRKQRGEDGGGLSASSTAPAVEGGSNRGNTIGEFADFWSVLTTRSASDAARTREHRDSAASASTATARSFRELHRKYSSAQQHHQSGLAGKNGSGSLRLPSDAEDSDAAVSFSDGRRTPLPPIDGEEEEGEAVIMEEEEGDMVGEDESWIAVASFASVEGVGDCAAVEEEEEEEGGDGNENRHTRFFTPEPRIRSPVASPLAGEERKEDAAGLESPVQGVGA